MTPPVDTADNPLIVKWPTTTSDEVAPWAGPRYLYVFDAANGTVLFQTRMPTSVQGFPITYAVRGKQYLAIPVGTGSGTWTSALPVVLTPEKSRPPSA